MGTGNWRHPTPGLEGPTKGPKALDVKAKAWRGPCHETGPVSLLRITSSGKLLGVKPKAGPTASKPHSCSAAVRRIGTGWKLSTRTNFRPVASGGRGVTKPRRHRGTPPCAGRRTGKHRDGKYCGPNGTATYQWCRNTAASRVPVDRSAPAWGRERSACTLRLAAAR